MNIVPTENNIFDKFLQTYSNTGSLLNSLDIHGLNINQLRKKQLSDKNFDNEYRKINQFVNTNKAILARERLIELRLQDIERGYLVEEDITREIIKNPITNEVVRVKDTTRKRKKPLPESYFSQYLDSNDIMKAIATLSEHGLIPESYAQKVLSMQSKIVEKIQQEFNPDNNTDELNKKQLVNLIKEALIEV